MQTTILTPTDVIQYSGIKLRNNPCDYRTIFNIEYSEFRSRLGLELYEDLKAALVDYSTATEYTGASTTVNGIVRFQGVYYKAKSTTTERPDNATYWLIAPKFEGDCTAVYETLFCDFLAEYLALSVLMIQLPFVADSVHTEGVLEYAGQDYKSANQDGITRLQHAIKSKRELVFNNMNAYLIASDSTCFDNYLGNLETGCGCTTKKNSVANGYDFG